MIREDVSLIEGRHPLLGIAGVFVSFSELNLKFLKIYLEYWSKGCNFVPQKGLSAGFFLGFCGHKVHIITLKSIT